MIIPIFKAFANTMTDLSFSWCEKKAKDSDYLWLVKNDFKKEKGVIKLLDGIGRMINHDFNILLIESSGYNNKDMIPHSLNDTLKNMKTGTDNLKYFISNFKRSSYFTIKKLCVFTCHVIHNKVTLVKYSIKSPCQWQVLECRSASVPLCFSNIVQFTKVFELFAFLQIEIREQEKVIQQLHLESSGLIEVPEDETVAKMLL